MMRVMITDNRGDGGFNGLQIATGGAEFTNLYRDVGAGIAPAIDFAAPAAADGW